MNRFGIILIAAVVAVNAEPKKASFSPAAVFQPGKSWEYKVFFIDFKNDTIDTTTTKLELIKRDSLLGIQTVQMEWKHNDASEPAVISKSKVSIELNLPKTGTFKSLGNLYIVPSCINKLDTLTIVKPGGTGLIQGEVVSRGPEKGRVTKTTYADTDTAITKKELKNWELEGGYIKGERLVIHYTPNIERKTVATLMQPFQECLEITAERRRLKLVENAKMDDLKAVFYFHEKYGFVRWEYTKPNGSKVIFDLRQVSGF